MKAQNLNQIAIRAQQQQLVTNPNPQLLNPLLSLFSKKCTLSPLLPNALTPFLPQLLPLHPRPQGLLLPPRALQSTRNPRVSPQIGSLDPELAPPLLPRQQRRRLRLKPLPINSPDVVPWTSPISGLGKSGFEAQALHYFFRNELEAQNCQTQCGHPHRCVVRVFISVGSETQQVCSRLRREVDCRRAVGLVRKDWVVEICEEPV